MALCQYERVKPVLPSGGTLLAEWIDRSKHTKTHVAQLLDISPSELSKWLSGVRSPGKTKIFQIEALTGIAASVWSRRVRK